MPGCECSSRFACAADRSRHAEPVETATQRATRRRTYPTPRRPAPKGRAPHRRRPQPARTIPPTTPTSTPTTRPAPITRRNRPSPARTPHRLPTREKCGLGSSSNPLKSLRRRVSSVHVRPPSRSQCRSCGNVPSGPPPVMFVQSTTTRDHQQRKVRKDLLHGCLSTRWGDDLPPLCQRTAYSRARLG